MKDCAQEMVGIDPDAKLRRIPQAAQSAAIRAGYSSTSEIVYYYNHIWRLRMPFKPSFKPDNPDFSQEVRDRMQKALNQRIRYGPLSGWQRFKAWWNKAPRLSVVPNYGAESFCRWVDFAADLEMLFRQLGIKSSFLPEFTEEELKQAPVDHTIPSVEEQPNFYIHMVLKGYNKSGLSYGHDGGNFNFLWDAKHVEEDLQKFDKFVKDTAALIEALVEARRKEALALALAE